MVNLQRDAYLALFCIMNLPAVLSVCMHLSIHPWLCKRKTKQGGWTG